MIREYIPQVRQHSTHENAVLMPAFPWVECWFFDPQVRQHSTHENAVLMLIANKVDLTPRQVSRDEGQTFAEEHGMLYIETSAKTRLSVDQAFTDLVKKILQDETLLEGTGPAGGGSTGGGSNSGGGAGATRTLSAGGAGEFGDRGRGGDCTC